MDKDDPEFLDPSLATLRMDLGLATNNLPVLANQSQGELTTVSLDVAGRSVVVFVPPAGKHELKRRFRELIRRERRRAAEAGNAAQTSQQVGAGIGGAIAASGVIALATASGPLTAAAVIATGIGAVIAGIGLLAGHWMNRQKFEHEERVDRYSEIVEELT